MERGKRRARPATKAQKIRIYSLLWDLDLEHDPNRPRATNQLDADEIISDLEARLQSKRQREADEEESHRVKFTLVYDGAVQEKKIGKTK